MLPGEADVVIIGGGIVGTSAAFHLAEAGVSVVLVERGQLASGSTSKAAGGVRAQFSDALNIQIGQRSLAAYADFTTRPGWEIDFERNGYLFLLTRDEDVKTFERSIALQNEHGVPSRLIGPEEALQLSPLLDVSDVIAAAYSPEDGHATPEAAVQGYAYGARQLGAHLETRCEATAILGGAQITAVQTSKGTIATGTVICAAGAWSQACGALAGVDLPITPLRREVMFTEPMDDLPHLIPLTIDFANGFYFHREGRGLLYGITDPDNLLEAAQKRAPRLVDAGVRGGWAGFYEMSPDHNAVIGEAAHVSRFLYATGFSGHGFLQGPATGELMRDLYLKRPTFVDITPLSADRFDGRTLRHEYNIV